MPICSGCPTLFANVAGALATVMLEQVNRGSVISVDGDIQSGAVIADRIDLRTAKQELLNYLEVAGISRLHQRRTTKFLASIYVSAFVEQITNDCHSSLAGCEKERRTAIASDSDVRARKMKQLHSTQTPIHGGLRKTFLPSRPDARQAAHHHQR